MMARLLLPLFARDFPAGLRTGPGPVVRGPFRVLERSVSAGRVLFSKNIPYW